LKSSFIYNAFIFVFCFPVYKNRVLFARCVCRTGVSQAQESTRWNLLTGISAPKSQGAGTWSVGGSLAFRFKHYF